MQIPLCYWHTQETQIHFSALLPGVYSPRTERLSSYFFLTFLLLFRACFLAALSVQGRLQKAVVHSFKIRSVTCGLWRNRRGSGDQFYTHSSQRWEETPAIQGYMDRHGADRTQSRQDWQEDLGWGFYWGFHGQGKLRSLEVASLNYFRWHQAIGVLLGCLESGPGVVKAKEFCLWRYGR